MTLPFYALLLPTHYALSLTNRTVLGTATSPADAKGGFRLGTDGKIYQARSHVSSGAYVEITGLQWLDPHDATHADAYECFATLDSGTLTAGTTGSWLALSSDRDWERERTDNALGTDTATITIQIRRVGYTEVLASAQIVLSAEVQ